MNFLCGPKDVLMGPFLSAVWLIHVSMPAVLVLQMPLVRLTIVEDAVLDGISMTRILLTLVVSYNAMYLLVIVLCQSETGPTY